jgi:predicted class III extradiol MEMO1 family dioxygenase
MAHVGPRFGDPGVLSAEGLSFLEGEDRRTLQLVAEGDAAGFYASVMEDNDPRRICGLSPIYGLLSALPSARGKVLRYEQTTDDTGTVNFASMGVWG